ncbi:MAG TPA: fumarylacetoacetate hydrolase family protein [Xanthobacteraceae bacterium]
MTAWQDQRIARGMQEQLAQRRVRLDAGDKPVGWKVGFGAPAVMEKLGISAPLVGHLLESGLVTAGSSVSFDGWIKPVVEPEIALYIGEDLPGGSSPAQAAAAIAALGPAFELADLRYLPEDAERIVADNIYQRHVVLGPRDDSRSGGNVRGLIGRVFRNGVEVARTSDPEANTGNLVDLVRHVADVLAAFGERLRAGEIIITGSIVPPLLAEKTDKEVVLELDPVGMVSVRVA